MPTANPDTPTAREEARKEAREEAGEVACERACEGAFEGACERAFEEACVPIVGGVLFRILAQPPPQGG